jgi:hypothetical protein
VIHRCKLFLGHRRFHKGKVRIAVGAILSCVAFGIVRYQSSSKSNLCDLMQRFDTSFSETVTIQISQDRQWWNLRQSQTGPNSIVVNRGKICFSFLANEGQILNITTSGAAFQVFEKSESIKRIWGGQDGGSRQLNRAEYFLRIETETMLAPYQVTMALQYQPMADAVPTMDSNSPINHSDTLEFDSFSRQDQLMHPSAATDHSLSSYNVKVPPYFIINHKLQGIIDRTINLIETQGLPKDNVSISLIDLNSGSCNTYGNHTTSCQYGGYFDQRPRFPASITKLFWMVALFGQQHEGILTGTSFALLDLEQMIQDSDNNPASKILDQITNTTSSPEQLPQAKIADWYRRRLEINHYFQQAGYGSINISQKNFPIPSLGFSEPVGPDQQIRSLPNYTVCPTKVVTSEPCRNYLTTHDTARLLLEIEQGQAITSEYSKQMKQLLRRNYAYESSKQYDAIEGFLGEGLDPNRVTSFSKVGWTSGSRQDAAIIYDRPTQARYILVIFADDPAFADDWEIFPAISSLVHQGMTE